MPQMKLNDAENLIESLKTMQHFLKIHSKQDEDIQHSISTLNQLVQITKNAQHMGKQIDFIGFKASAAKQFYKSIYNAYNFLQNYKECTPIHNEISTFLEQDKTIWNSLHFLKPYDDDQKEDEIFDIDDIKLAHFEKRKSETIEHSWSSDSQKEDFANFLVEFKHYSFQQRKINITRFALEVYHGNKDLLQPITLYLHNIINQAHAPSLLWLITEIKENETLEEILLSQYDLLFKKYLKEIVYIYSLLQKGHQNDNTFQQILEENNIKSSNTYETYSNMRNFLRTFIKNLAVQIVRQESNKRYAEIKDELKNESQEIIDHTKNKILLREIGQDYHLVQNNKTIVGQYIPLFFKDKGHETVHFFIPLMSFIQNVINEYPAREVSLLLYMTAKAKKDELERFLRTPSGLLFSRYMNNIRYLYGAFHGDNKKLTEILENQNHINPNKMNIHRIQVFKNIRQFAKDILLKTAEHIEKSLGNENLPHLASRAKKIINDPIFYNNMCIVTQDKIPETAFMDVVFKGYKEEEFENIAVYYYSSLHDLLNTWTNQNERCPYTRWPHHCFACIADFSPERLASIYNSEDQSLDQGKLESFSINSPPYQVFQTHLQEKYSQQINQIRRECSEIELQILLNSDCFRKEEYKKNNARFVVLCENMDHFQWMIRNKIIKMRDILHMEPKHLELILGENYLECASIMRHNYTSSKDLVMSWNDLIDHKLPIIIDGYLSYNELCSRKDIKNTQKFIQIPLPNIQFILQNHEWVHYIIREMSITLDELSTVCPELLMILLQRETEVLKLINKYQVPANVILESTSLSEVLDHWKQLKSLTQKQYISWANLLSLSSDRITLITEHINSIKKIITREGVEYIMNKPIDELRREILPMVFTFRLFRPANAENNTDPLVASSSHIT